MSRRGQQLFNSGSLRICVHAGGGKDFEVSTQRRGRQLTRPAPSTKTRVGRQFRLHSLWRCSLFVSYFLRSLGPFSLS